MAVPKKPLELGINYEKMEKLFIGKDYGAGIFC